MKGIIGSKPAVSSDTMPHVAVILGQVASPLGQQLQVAERHKRFPRERNLNVDALNVVNLLSASTVAPVPQKREKGEWLDETFSGGVLLIYEMMLAAVKAKEDAAALKEGNKKSAADEKVEREAMNQRDKFDHQTEKSRRVVRK